MNNNYVALTCKKCGGALNPDTMRCPYCGTYHKWEDNYTERVLVELERPGIKVYQAKMAIDRYATMCMSPEQLAMFIKNEMAQKLIRDGVAENIEMMNDYSIERNVDVYYGRVRVLEPSYRF